MNTTLPTDSEERKNVPLVSGCLNYFPAALAGVARVSKVGNDRHNPGQPLHHARGKSTDHADCMLRHLVDLQGLLAQLDRMVDPGVSLDANLILSEASALAWRALALSQGLHERFGAPLAPGARLPDEASVTVKYEFVDTPTPHTSSPEFQYDATRVRPNGQLNSGERFNYVEPVLQPEETAAIREEFDGSKRVVLPASPAPLQLEVGKRYVRRDGKVSGVISTVDHLNYPFYDETGLETYTENGRVFRSVEHKRDLLREYLPESGD